MSRTKKYIRDKMLAADALAQGKDYISDTTRRISFGGLGKAASFLWNGPKTREEGKEAFTRFAEGVDPSEFPEFIKSTRILLVAWVAAAILMILFSSWSFAHAWRMEDGFELVNSLLTLIPILGALLMSAITFRRLRIIQMKRIVGLKEILF